jgi:PTH2 family peptidyl-tRNA hydrolase
VVGVSEFKQAIIIRCDLGMGKGKMVAQGSHASLLAFEEALKKNEEAARAWQASGSKKIVLRAASEKELVELYAKARKARLPAALVVDAGHTQIEAGTKTAAGIGPAEESALDKITGKLRLL